MATYPHRELTQEEWITEWASTLKPDEYIKSHDSGEDWEQASQAESLSSKATLVEPDQIDLGNRVTLSISSKGKSLAHPKRITNLRINDRAKQTAVLRDKRETRNDHTTQSRRPRPTTPFGDIPVYCPPFPPNHHSQGALHQMRLPIIPAAGPWCSRNSAMIQSASASQSQMIDYRLPQTSTPRMYEPLDAELYNQSDGFTSDLLFSHCPVVSYPSIPGKSASQYTESSASKSQEDEDFFYYSSQHRDHDSWSVDSPQIFPDVSLPFHLTTSKKPQHSKATSNDISGEPHYSKRVGRSDLYELGPAHDGLYHCPFVAEGECNRRPDKLKCNYNKHMDSHLKPYRCHNLACIDIRFSSTASLLRHEREAHGLHSRGERPYSCHFEGCERAKPEYAFPRRWNLQDHLRRVHKYVVESTGEDIFNDGAGTTKSPYAANMSKRASERFKMAMKDQSTQTEADTESLNQHLSCDDDHVLLSATSVLRNSISSPPSAVSDCQSIGSCDSTSFKLFSNDHINHRSTEIVIFLAERIIQRCIALYWALQSGGAKSCNPSLPGSSQIVQASTTHNGSQKASLKRQRSANNAENEDADEDFGAIGSSGQKRKKSQCIRLFACPYAKFDPERYSPCNQSEKIYRKCSSHRLVDISRIKQHLERAHKRPDFYCGVCYEEFSDRDLFHDHQRMRPPCNQQPIRFEERMTDNQYRDVKSNRLDNTRESWYKIFRILFPYAPEPASPYVSTCDQATLQHFIELFRIVGPEVMVHHLRGPLGQDTSSSDVNASLRNIIEEAFEIVLPGFEYELQRQPNRDGNGICNGDSDEIQTSSIGNLEPESEWQDIRIESNINECIPQTLSLEGSTTNKEWDFANFSTLADAATEKGFSDHVAKEIDAFLDDTIYSQEDDFEANLPQFTHHKPAMEPQAQLGGHYTV